MVMMDPIYPKEGGNFLRFSLSLHHSTAHHTTPHHRATKFAPNHNNMINGPGHLKATQGKSRQL